MDKTLSEGDSVRPQAKTKVFISYSRKDKDFAEKLAPALEAAGLEVFIDTSEHRSKGQQDAHGIAKFEDWWKRLEDMITKADTVIYVISPDSMSSSVCEDEVNFAVSLNKRIAPIVWRDPGTTNIPKALSKLNYLFFNSDQGFDTQVDALTEELKKDIGWIRQHTRFSELALAWQADQKSSNKLLRGNDIEQAEKWRDSHPKDTEPPTSLQLEYITASRKGAGKRRKMLIGSLAAGLVIAVGLGGLAFLQRVEAVKAQKLAEKNEKEALKSQSRVLSKLAIQENNEGDSITAMLLSIESLPSLDNKKLPYIGEAEFSLNNAIAANSERFLLNGRIGDIEGRAIDKTQTKLITLKSDHSIVVWNIQSGQELFRLNGHTSHISQASFSPSSSLILTTSLDGTSKIWNANNGKLKQTFKSDLSLGFGRFSPDESKVASISQDGMMFGGRTIFVWDAQTGTEIFKIDTVMSRFSEVEFNSKGDRLLTRGQTHNGASIWDAINGNLLSTLSEHTEAIKFLKFSPSGKYILTGSWYDIKIWRASTEKLQLQIPLKSYILNNIYFSADEDKLLTSTRFTTSLWDLNTGQEVISYRGHQGEVHSAAFNSDEGKLLTVSNNSIIKIWDRKSATLLRTLKITDDSLQYAMWAYHDKFIIAAGSSKTHIFSADKVGRSYLDLKGHSGQVHSVKYSNDEKLIASGGYDGSLRIWNAVTGKVESVFKSDGFNKSYVSNLQFNPDSTRIISTLTGNHKNTKKYQSIVHLRDLVDQKLIATFLEYDAISATAKISKDGKRIIVKTQKNIITLFDGLTGQKVSDLKGHNADIQYIEFSPNSKLIVTSSATYQTLNNRVSNPDHSVRIWHADTGQMKQIILDHKDNVQSLIFSPDSKYLAITSLGPDARLTVFIWDTNSGKLLQSLKVSNKADKYIGSISFSSDNTKLITQTRSTAEIKIWKFLHGKLLRSFIGTGDFQSILSHDGKRVLFKSKDENSNFNVDNYLLYNLDTGRLVSNIEAGVRYADGARIYGLSKDGMIAIWDMKNGTMVNKIPASTDWLYHTINSKSANLVASYDSSIRIFKIFPNYKLSLQYAKKNISRCLSLTKRKFFYLDSKPPRWCITNKKYPYHTDEWRDWLAAKDAGLEFSMPIETRVEGK